MKEIEKLEKAFCFKSPVIKQDFHSILTKLFMYTTPFAEQYYFPPAVEYAKHDIAMLKAFDQKDKRIAELERRLKIACHVKADDKVKFDWAVLDKIDELEENLKAAEAVINYYKNLMEAK